MECSSRPTRIRTAASVPRCEYIRVPTLVAYFYGELGYVVRETFLASQILSRTRAPPVLGVCYSFWLDKFRKIEMALKKIFCPCCSQSFYGSDQVGAVISCSNCGRALEIKDGTVKEHVPGMKGGAAQTVVEQSLNSQPQQSPVTSYHSSPESAVSSDAPVQPPELDIPNSSTHSVFDVAALQTVIWKVILPAGLACAFVATVLMVARQTLKKNSIPRPTINLSPHSPVSVVRTQPRQLSAQNQSSPQKQTPDSSERPTSPPTESNTTGDRVMQAIQSVAVVADNDGHGSGFVASDNMLVTNYHVIEKSKIEDVRIIFPDYQPLEGQSLPVKLVEFDHVNDLALLSFNADVPPLTVKPSYVYKKGQPVTAIGSPGTGGSDTLVNFVTDGRLGPPATEHRWWSLSMPINGGNSGGPVLDSKTGEVIAVVVATYRETQSQGLAVSHEVLLELLQSGEKSDQSSVQKTKLEHRIRCCLHELVKILSLEQITFNMSCRVAVDDEDGTPESRLRAFNQFKSEVTSKLGEEYAIFETELAEEVHLLQQQSESQAAARGLKKLHDAIDDHASQLRKSVGLSSVEQYLKDFRASLEHAWDLADASAEMLGIDIENPRDNG